MNRREHLLDILGEECGEVHKVASKIMRFGLDANKRDWLQAEYNEVLAMIEMLADEGIVVYKQPLLIQAKKDKVEAMLLESKALGTLNE